MEGCECASNVGITWLSFSCLNWVVYSQSNNSVFCNVVLLFDMGSEVFREMRLPKKLVLNFRWTCLLRCMAIRFRCFTMTIVVLVPIGIVKCG